MREGGVVKVSSTKRNLKGSIQGFRKQGFKRINGLFVIIRKHGGSMTERVFQKHEYNYIVLETCF